jgi:hypothetical protein
MSATGANSLGGSEKFWDKLCKILHSETFWGLFLYLNIRAKNFHDYVCKIWKRKSIWYQYFFYFLSNLSEFLWFLNTIIQVHSNQVHPHKNFLEKKYVCYTLLNLYSNKPIFFNYGSSYLKWIIHVF